MRPASAWCRALTGSRVETPQFERLIKILQSRALTGSRVETGSHRPGKVRIRVEPSRARGLKYCRCDRVVSVAGRALTGSRVETGISATCRRGSRSSPHKLAGWNEHTHSGFLQNWLIMADPFAKAVPHASMDWTGYFPSKTMRLPKLARPTSRKCYAALLDGRLQRAASRLMRSLHWQGGSTKVGACGGLQAVGL